MLVCDSVCCCVVVLESQNFQGIWKTYRQRRLKLVPTVQPLRFAEVRRAEDASHDVNFCHVELFKASTNV